MRYGALIFILATVLAGPANAQSKAGTTIGQFTLIEPSAQFSGMGNAGVALADGLQSVYYNPAAAGLLERPGLQFSHLDWIADIGYEYVAAAYPVSDLGVAYASVTALNSGDILVRTVEQPLGTGERYSVSNLGISAGFARKFSYRFSAGAQINYIQESIWHSSLQTVTISMGTIYQVTDGGMKIGASITNFGTRSKFSGRDLAILYDNDPDRYGDNSALPGQRSTDDFPVPMLFRLGISFPYRMEKAGTVRLAVDAFQPNSNTESMSAGVEWTWRESVSIRTGYQNLGLEDAEVGATFGAGFRGDLGAQVFRFDYAWADQGRLEETHRFTFALDF